MNLFRYFQSAIVAEIDALIAAGALPAGLDLDRIAVDPPRDGAHGDIASNAAMALASAARRKPRELAALLAERLLKLPDVDAVEVAGPGFINLRLSDQFWHARLVEILSAGRSYGDSQLGNGRPVNIEYVSANPTGPLHVGHGRGAVVGDALAGLLAKAGFHVTREYYVNDAGGQVDALARSLRLRYLIAIGAEQPETFEEKRTSGEVQYGGDYLVPVAEALAALDGDRWAVAPEWEWLPIFRDFAVERMLLLISADLAALGIHFQVIASERAMVEAGGVDSALRMLDDAGLIYEGVLEPPKGKLPDDWEARPQTLFRSTRFGDEVDRPLKKSDGSWTYFAADIAYHLDKFRRGFPTMIDVWGADHGGYVKRMQAAVDALTGGAGALDVKLCQLVNLLEGGQPVRMSKRAGTFVTLRDVVDRVGRDVFRFIMLTRKNDAPLDFDFQKVTQETRDNPVFYVQYAHARCCSVLRHAAAEMGDAAIDDARLGQAPFVRLTDPVELGLIKVLAGWPRLVESAAEAHEPHRIAFFLQDVAQAFHGLWTKGKEDAQLRFIHLDDLPMTVARLALVRATQLVIASGLDVIGVEPVEELR
ncbi:MAG: arginine--tRNA ligase [Rhodospirillales bacterium]|nr:arginine--tRNA ligase [Rhodospirillales bacterium]